MQDNSRDPFDPNWYKDAFDKFGSVADQLSDQNMILDQGYHIPDADGSRSSIVRNNAVLNNSFSERVLKETLDDIYFNSSHKLIASNHDEVNFFQWNGFMSDMVYIPSTNLCEFRIPWNRFISSNERDSYKISQFYRNWIKVEDILNNWDVFKWHLMLFIDKKVYSEYEIRIDDQEVIIKFKYKEEWVNKNYPVYIYKFNTNSQCRVLISRELCVNQWDWKMPIDKITNKRIINSPKVMVAFNKISDPDIREDGKTNVNVLGDNLEFFDIKDGYIVMSTISDFNKEYITSERIEWLWMSIIVPKFFHEYPIILPTDSIYRPYNANLYKVYTSESDGIKQVKSYIRNIEQRQVYVDINGEIFEPHNGWTQMIRPIVLTDAFDPSNNEPSETLMAEVMKLRDCIVDAADIIEEFRFFMKEAYIDDEKLNSILDDIVSKMDKVHEAYNEFLVMRRIEEDTEYENIINNTFKISIDDIRNNKDESIWLNPYKNSDNTFWKVTSSLITIPQELVDKFYVVNIIHGIDRKNVWEDTDSYSGKIRFQRPIEENDFWMFEYDEKCKVWRPIPLEISRHFPDVYLAKDPTEEIPTLNRIFKAFFFYSDTMNVLNEARVIDESTPMWDEDTIKYYHEPRAVYRDIFMEKFYWMGIKSIYKGLLTTDCRWEVIEHVIDNNSYKRFNELFIHTMDPYFKLGLSTYLNSSNYEFPFDDAISKMEESIKLDHSGYKKISNFEMYLNKHWIPSYFDYMIKIMDSWDCGNKLVRRPPNTFDMRKLQPAIIDVQNEIIDTTKLVFENLELVLLQFKEETYGIDVIRIKEMYSSIKKLLNTMETVLDFITNLDLNITSIDDINYIILNLKKYGESMVEINSIINELKENVETSNVYEYKRSIIKNAQLLVSDLPSYIDKVMTTTQSFDMDNFMKSINDLNSYFDHAKTNPDDNSLLGQINKFGDPWTASVKAARNELFTSTSILYGTFDPKKIYSNEEVTNFVSMVSRVKEGIEDFKNEIDVFWNRTGLEKDQVIIDRLDHVSDVIDKFKIDIQEYYDYRNDLVGMIDKIINTLSSISAYRIGEKENKCYKYIRKELQSVVDALSYIAGSNHKDDAIKSLSNVNNGITDWLALVSTEENVFDILFDIIENSGPFLTVMNENLEIIECIISYMDTVNLPFTPDINLPTYSDVYEIDSIEIDNRGFRYKIGDLLFVPNLGSYKVTSTIGNISRVESVTGSGFRRTTFRDPMVQRRSYDSTSNSVGTGFTIKAISSTNIKIINDEVCVSTVIRSKNILERIKRFLITPNPYNNIEYSNTIDDIKEIESNWNRMMGKFSDYVTIETKNKINSLITTLLAIIPVSEKFMNNRLNIQPQELAVSLEKFFHEVYKHITSINQDTEEFYYYDNEIRVIHNNLITFIDSNTSWKDGEALKKILFECKGTLKTYDARILSMMDPSDKLIELQDLLKQLYSKIDLINTSISNIPGYVTPIQSAIDHVNLELMNIPNEFRRDIWYKINKVIPATWGENYQRGDIVELIPELPVDIEGNPVYDMKDIILNDRIFLQVMEVEDGKVKKIQPLMNYAIPYLIWGIRNTVTHTGHGTGLTVDMFSNQITTSDSTLLRDENTFIPTPPAFNESDLMAFKFENIHDLDITYEIFFGGKQITDFFQTHESDDNHLHPGKIDVLYVNANEVEGLKNSSIHIPAEHYFIYKINDITIKDPGTGYCVGQDIFVEANQIALRLKVAKLVYEPYKGIEQIDIIEGSIVHGNENPSMDNAEVSTDALNNIDDEYSVSYYDSIPKEGIKKAATLSYPQEKYEFVSKRFDDLDGNDRNETFMYPDVDMVESDISAENGDPEYHWYQGSRIDNSQHPMSDERRWNGIMNLNPPTNPFIHDSLRLPPNKPVKGEYQMFDRVRIHDSGDITLQLDSDQLTTDGGDITATINVTLVSNIEIFGDLEVDTFADIPRHVHDWPEGRIGKTVVVKCDETNNGHRMIYRVRSFIAAGFFVYNLPEIADKKWNTMRVDWMNVDWYPDLPSLKSQYPSAPWRTAKSYRIIQEGITDKKYQREHVPQRINKTSYIHQLSLDDLSIFNWTTKQWEDLHDATRWKLDVYDDPENNNWGFALTFLQEGLYEYDMKLYLNKIPETQIKNSKLRRNAVMDISAVIIGEVDKPAIDMTVNTGRSIRIRKLFPYEQKQSFTIGTNVNGDPLGYEMDFKLAPYMHYKNEIHLEDIKIFNKTANRFENILDRKMFEVRFKDPNAVSRGYEIQTTMVQSVISNSGEGFIDGQVWGWNEEFGIHIFGNVTAAFRSSGYLLTFTPTHCPNPPTENMTLEFQVYQRETQTDLQMAIVLIEFKTEKVEVYGDGYIHNVTNPLAPVPDEIKIIAQYNLDGPYEYDVIINKSPTKWVFVDPNWMMIPTFKIPNRSISQDKFYVVTSNGRLPLINPSTMKPTLTAKEVDDGTEITFMNLYRRYEHLEVRTVPYPMRSVYVKRKIPSHGFIDLAGKINKPLNKKYFEFWINGRLLDDEVTIISPTKLFLHGLKSLKNFEIIEINRDPNEYFSDIFLEKRELFNRPIPYWNYKTYLDEALEGTLESDNYSLEEQEYLLTPVWNQVESDHPSFKDYPPNVDIESDIIQRVQSNDNPNIESEESSFEYMMIDTPTLEGIPLTSRKMKFSQFGWRAISEDMIVDILNDLWADQISNNPYFHSHVIIGDDDWYGTTARLYDEYGILVHTLNEAVYTISDSNILKLDSTKKIGRIVHGNISYDLT